MITKRLGVDKQGIETAAEILKDGGIVAIPTETVYGLAANAFDEDAIKSVFSAKGRPQDNPLIVHISSIEMLHDLAVDIPETAYKCAEKFWPGPLTMVLKKSSKVGSVVSGGLDTVAIRMPGEKVAYDIIQTSGLPLAAPSANVSGRPSPTSYTHVLNDLDGKIDAVVEGKDCTVGVESTVITLVGEHPVLLRPGAVTLEQLKEIFPDITVDNAVLSELKEGQKASSPGMKYKHYSPKTETFLVEGDNFANFVNEKPNSIAICFSEEAEDIKIPKIIYGDKKDPMTLAQNIFSALREVDKMDKNEVYVHAPEKSGVGLAVYNRLIRAAAFKVIKL